MGHPSGAQLFISGLAAAVFIDLFQAFIRDLAGAPVPAVPRAARRFVVAGLQRAHPRRLGGDHADGDAPVGNGMVELV